MEISLKNNFLDNFDDNSNSLCSTEALPAKATIDSASAYCQKCLNKSIASFQINNLESIKLCINPSCQSSLDPGSQITYDTNNNQAQQPKKFKYSSKIESLNAKELKDFFETDLNSVELYQNLSSVFNHLVKPIIQINEIETLTNTALQSKEDSHILLEPSAEYIFETPALQTESKFSIVNNDRPAVADQKIVFENFQITDPASNTPFINDINFENEFLQMLDDDTIIWQNTDLTNSEFLPTNNDVILPNILIDDQNQGQINVGSESLIKASEIDQTDILSELLGLDTTIPEQKESSYVLPIPQATPQNFQTILDTKTNSGSRIKITKIPKKKKESMFDQIELVNGDIITKNDSNSSVKYDSIGENEDSSNEQLLPWEIKSSSSKRKNNNTQYKHLEKMMARSSPVSPSLQKRPSEISSLIPNKVTKADLSSKKGNRSLFEGFSGSGDGNSFKKALSTSHNFKEEINKTTRISHLFNADDLIKSSPFGGSRGVKDLVLNILKKKQNN